MFYKFTLNATLISCATLLILSGCTKTLEVSTSELDSETINEEVAHKEEDKRIDESIFPQKTCGDSLPSDPSEYPINFYPVFTDYSEDDLEKIKQGLCEDAIQKYRADVEKDSIQVASFIDVERAEIFRNFLRQKIGNGEIGEPTVVNPYEDKNILGKQYLSGGNYSKEVASSAGLSSEKIAKLLDSKTRGLQNMEIIIPTYVPKGFELVSVEVNEATYSVGYRNSDNFCFGFGGFDTPGSGSPGEYENVLIDSPAFGEVFLAYTDFDQFSGKPLVASPGYWGNVKNVNVGKYSFSSASYSLEEECKAIKLEEAIKVVESLQFLTL